MDEHTLKECVEYLAQFVTAQKWQKIQRVASQRTRHIAVVLEHLNQPLNMSAALRSAEALGIQDLYVVDSPKFKSELNPGVTKGSEAWVSMFRYRGIEGEVIKNCLADLKNKGYSIIATMPHMRGQTPEELPLDSKIALVFGNEEFGVSQYTKENADGFLTVPMYGFTESFNVSATVAMSIHTLVERLKKSNILWALSEKEYYELCSDWLKKNLRDGQAIEKKFLLNK